jgi:hypothetical protein
MIVILEYIDDALETLGTDLPNIAHEGRLNLGGDLGAQCKSLIMHSLYKCANKLESQRIQSERHNGAPQPHGARCASQVDKP